MRVALIGHRGVGKTSFLARVKQYFDESSRKVLCLDLDQEIEKRTSRTIVDIFAKGGETEFRRIEFDTFDAIDRETRDQDVYLAIGAGFDIFRVPEEWKTLWLRRSTDAQGRIFTDRPRLNSKLSTLGEYLARFEERQNNYRKRADESLWLDEGLDRPDHAEKDFVLDQIRDLGGAITLLPENFRKHFVSWIQKRVSWGVRWFELRDDLLSQEQIITALSILPRDLALFSFRSTEKIEASRKLVESENYAYDWPVELGSCQLRRSPRFYSIHERKPGEPVSEALARLPKAANEIQLKAALPILSFQELAEGEKWRAEHPTERVFLPRSDDGRWAWYRLHQRQMRELNFIREGEGSGADQPSLLQWARARGSTNFAAILGDPVKHSYTPIEQDEFFARKSADVVAIQIQESEWQQAIPVLKDFGLRWAAVTAPLKLLAHDLCQTRDPLATELKSVNTLALNKDGWHGTNTDLAGFQNVVESETSLGEIAVWGGGGTLNVIKKILPQAQFFSIRSGTNRDGGADAKELNPDTVIWAVGRTRADGQYEAPSSWKPKLVIDLNYSEDSPGRDFAVKHGARYVSGIKMFRAQAKAQREFWERQK